MVGHESQVIAKPSPMAPQADSRSLSVPHDSEDEPKVQEDLAPAKGILVSLFLGGVIWLIIIYVLSRVS